MANVELKDQSKAGAVRKKPSKGGKCTKAEELGWFVHH